MLKRVTKLEAGDLGGVMEFDYQLNGIRTVSVYIFFDNERFCNNYCAAKIFVHLYEDNYDDFLYCCSTFSQNEDEIANARKIIGGAMDSRDLNKRCKE